MSAKKILITRDIKGAKKTKSQLDNINIESEIFPLCNLKLRNVILDDLSLYNNIIITSQNALEVRDISYWQNIAKKTKLLIIGDNFAKYLLDNQIFNFKNFDKVEELIFYLKKHKKNQYLYLRGKEVSYDLKSITDLEIEEIICYEMEYFSIDTNELEEFLINNKITDLLFLSLSNAKRFIELSANLHKYRINCLSDRIAELFKGSGAKINYPKRPNFAELLKIIKLES